MKCPKCGSEEVVQIGGNIAFDVFGCFDPDCSRYKWKIEKTLFHVKQYMSEDRIDHHIVPAYDKDQVRESFLAAYPNSRIKVREATELDPERDIFFVVSSLPKWGIEDWDK